MTTPSTPSMPALPPMPAVPASVLFVCVHNGGKSQIAAGLARRLAPHVRVESAGTDPSATLHDGSVRTLAEIGIDISDQRPRPLVPELVEAADLVVVLGTEARVSTHDGTPVETWAVDEPSLRGIEGPERLRLMRDEIADRVRGLLVDDGAGAVSSTTPVPHGSGVSQVSR